ncbi:hypothetical protein FWJ25_17100 [Marinobacter salinexigens]|uniref:Toxin VasX N-terminal region domain-containing protein n=1 Tax=Marinobacter salinexigens TaxID=2919747 RepID=A0A5B0V9N6_9GAMM|nr:toxin VasX [Marinobacter salinexigens]KAA1171124.1 hypothetical protein FWJ25_17100 [Marinobacter salinexigens]
MGSANSAAFLQGRDDINSAVQVCPLQQKTVALYPTRWAISQEPVTLPDNFFPPSVALDKTHYCVRKLTTGWVYLYSEAFATLHEYRVDEQGAITEVLPGNRCELLPDVDADSALPCIHHPAIGTVFLKFVRHRWTVRLQELIRVDAVVRAGYMQAFELDGLPETGEGVNIAETEIANQVVEDFRPEPIEFNWSLTDFAQGIEEPDFNGICKKATEFSYCVALDDEIGITSELGQLHALYVNLIQNHAEENAYAYTTAQMVDALIAQESAKNEDEDDRKEVADKLKERIRASDKEAFVERYHKQIEEYDQARSQVFDDWKKWVDSNQLASKLQFNDLYSADGFQAVEQELADILDGYVSAEKGREDAKAWLEPSNGSSVVGAVLKSVLFLVTSTNKITEKLKDLPDFDYGSLKIVDSMYDMPGYVTATLATDTLLLEFAAPAADMGGWAANPQTRPQWKKWIKRVSKRYEIDIHEHGMTLDDATEFLLKANREALAGVSGYDLTELSMTPLAAGLMEANIRNRLRDSLIDVFHLDPNLRDNPFGWLHTRLDPVVEGIKQNRGRFIGAVTLFQAFNLVSLFSGLKETQQDVMMSDRQAALDRWLPFMDGLWNLAEGVVNLSGLLIRSEYAKALGVDLAAAGTRVSVIFNGTRAVEAISKGTKIISKVAVKYLPFVGPLLAIGLEGRAGWRAWHTGHNMAVALAAVQIGLTIGIGYLTALAVAGTVVGAPVVLVGAVLVVISITVTAIQLYIARSRIEDFLSQSFWGNAPYLRYWDGQRRPRAMELLETSKAIVSSDKGIGIRSYFEAEVDAFYYLLFSPVVRINDFVASHWETTRQGELKVLSEFTSFAVHFPGFDEGTCTVSIQLYEASRHFFTSNDVNDISDVFDARQKVEASPQGATYRFTHFNHEKYEQLELLIEYVKDGRKVTGDEGLRIILDGTDVEELGVDERLTFEL